MTELLPVSLVAHHVFCPRRAWLEVQGEQVSDSYAMTVGTISHITVDDASRSRSHRLRAVEFVSDRIGVVGRCDTVEVEDNNSVTVIEHKSTPVRKIPKVMPSTAVQVVLQVLALRDMGHDVKDQHVYFTDHRVKVHVDVDDATVAEAMQAVVDTNTTINSSVAPPPLEDDRRCIGCSHSSICLPDERELSPIRKKIRTEDSGTKVLHVTEQGARIRKKDGMLIVEKRDETLAKIPIEQIASIVVHGNIDISGASIRELLFRRVPVLWLSSAGIYAGVSVPAGQPNGQARTAQHVWSNKGRLDIPCQMVSAKIANQATLLRRLGDDRNSVKTMRKLSKSAIDATSLENLLGLEGEAASLYFGSFRSMLGKLPRSWGADFSRRTRNPAQDPVNACLNYVYALLLADAVKSLVACGLDPNAGFLHSSGRNKPAMALDLVEEFRAPVGDSVVVGALNNGELGKSDFTSLMGNVRLSANGRRSLVSSYERRMANEFRHPVFEYSVSWRRAMEVQARMVLGVLDGTQSMYKGIKTR